MSTPDADRLADALAAMANGEVSAGDGEPLDADAFTDAVASPPGQAPLPHDQPGAPMRAARPVAPTIAPPPLPEPIAPVPVAEALPDEEPAPFALPVEEEVEEETVPVEPLVADDIPVSAPSAPAEDGPRVDLGPSLPAEVYRPTTTAAQRRAAIYQTLEFRRTVIPVLLVAGVLLIVLAIASYLVSPTSPLSALPLWVPPALFLFGLMLESMAALNMLSVKHQLDDSRA